MGELKKVSWPTFKDVIASTKVVFFSTVIVSAVLGLLDWLFTSGLGFIY